MRFVIRFLDQDLSPNRAMTDDLGLLAGVMPLPQPGVRLTGKLHRKEAPFDSDSTI